MPLTPPYVPNIKPPAPPESDFVISGSPEGVVTASVGAQRLDGDTDTLYVKETGDGNTGWVEVSGGEGGGDLSTSDINTSAKLKAIVTDETGSGALVFADDPVLGDVTAASLEVGDEADAGDIVLGDGDGNSYSMSAPTFDTLTDGATITQTMTSAKVSQNAKVTITDNRTLAFSGLVNGMSGILIVKQDGSGGSGLTLPASSVVIDDGGGSISLTPDANAIDVLSWIYDGTNIFWTYGLNFS